MRSITLWLWVALVGCVLQFVALVGFDFYEHESGKRENPFFGIPHTSDLIVLSAVVAVGLFAATALGRNPIRGRSVGLVLGVVGVLATLQLGYRMIVPPFSGSIETYGWIFGGGCYFYCPPSEAPPTDLLAGIWLAFAGCLAVTVGGLLHAFSRTARETPAGLQPASSQSGVTLWLGLASLGAVGQWVLGYTFFTFYRTDGRFGEQFWSGWLPTPHTSSLVSVVTLAVVGITWAAARGRSPLGPAALGWLVAALGFVSTGQILYRIVDHPFARSNVSTVEIGTFAYLALLAAALIIVAGTVQAVTHKGAAGADASGRT
jgi:hypothetical protein